MEQAFERTPFSLISPALSLWRISDAFNLHSYGVAGCKDMPAK
jgi:hypothetical protein